MHGKPYGNNFLNLKAQKHILWEKTIFLKYFFEEKNYNMNIINSIHQVLRIYMLNPQTPGGTRGFNSKPESMSKYYLIAEYRTIDLRELREVIGLDGSKLAHPDLHRSRIQKDEADVETLVDLMENSWLNPMCPEESEMSVCPLAL